MRVFVISFFLALAWSINISAQTNSKAIFHLPTSNYKLITWENIYSHGGTSIERDFDKDGIKEKILVKRDTPNGYKILGIQGQYGYHLSPAYVEELDMLQDQFGDLNENSYIQISYYDLDSDNKDELIVTVGDMLVTSVTAIYKVRKSSSSPFVCLGQIEGQGELYLNGKTIIVPVGSQGLYRAFKVQGGKMTEVSSSFY